MLTQWSNGPGCQPPKFSKFGQHFGREDEEKADLLGLKKGARVPSLFGSRCTTRRSAAPPSARPRRLVLLKWHSKSQSAPSLHRYNLVIKTDESEKTVPTEATPAAALAALITQRVHELRHRVSQKEIARAAGFQSVNFLSMLKNGAAKLPLDRVASLAKALEIEEKTLMTLAIRQFHSERVIRAIEATLLRSDLSAAEEAGTVFSPDLHRLLLEASTGRMRARQLWREIVATRKLLASASRRHERVEKGMGVLIEELEEVVRRGRKLGGGMP
jgi:transcriptional regulator with XRE-family HTH domain